MQRLLAVLVTLVLVSLPAVALAHEDRAVPFTATGQLCLQQLPSDIEAELTPTGVWIEASGEQLGGSITSSEGWSALQGAGVAVTVKEEDSFFDFITNTFHGYLKAGLVVSTPAGDLSGKIKGAVSGAFADPANIIDSIYTSQVVFTWEVEGEEAEAKGTGSALFTADPVAGTYCGTVIFKGIVK
ncbi:MAG: hypothetical protein HY683_02560 [Chloroflexi bacterium]|nr:hypothetical protein [Chloroflexota bacterium]